MTKEELRTALKQLAVELDVAIKFERSSKVTLPVPAVDRWRRRLVELSEEDLLWT